MQTTETFIVGRHEYAVEMGFEEYRGKWYEIWKDGQLLGERNSWPQHENGRLYTPEQLVRKKQRIFEEQARRKGEAS